MYIYMYSFEYEFVETGTPEIDRNNVNVLFVNCSGVGSGTWKPLVASHGRY